MSTTAHAHPNIALIKYWGKAPGPGNVPATPSLSVTLDALTTTTTVTESERDEFVLDGNPVADAKVTACLADLRRQYRIPPLSIRSENDFPTAAGLASSASGFAALITAIDAACGLDLSPAARSDFARQASASAARSLFGGFVTLAPPEWQGRPLLGVEDWPLRVVIAVTSSGAKAVKSSEGMRLSAETSPFYPAWVASTPDDFAAAEQAVEARDFPVLAELAEHSSLKMHGLMLSSRPGLLYWNPTTLACLQRVRELQADGVTVFATMDAGPQVKAICPPASEAAVMAALGTVPGVLQLLSSGLGRGAWVAR